ncbi:MAG: hypothetical protein WCR04_11530 [Fibrobacteraceae bacterium]
MIDRIKWAFFALIILTFVAYFFFPLNIKHVSGDNGIYGISTNFRWIFYFGYMLLGAWLGMRVRTKPLTFKLKLDFVKLILCFAAFYGIMLFYKSKPQFVQTEIVTIFPLAGIVYYLYKVCNSSACNVLYSNRYVHAIVLFVGGLCLESYLCQLAILTPRYNEIFPLNLVFVWSGVLAFAYVLRCFARLFSQTFCESNYNIREILKPF